MWVTRSLSRPLTTPITGLTLPLGFSLCFSNCRTCVSKVQQSVSFFRDAIFSPTFGPPHGSVTKTNTDSDVTTDVLPLLFLSSCSQKVTESIFRPENRLELQRTEPLQESLGRSVTQDVRGAHWHFIGFHRSINTTSP